MQRPSGWTVLAVAVTVLAVVVVVWLSVAPPCEWWAGSPWWKIPHNCR